MLKSQKLEIRSIAIREKMDSLIGGESLTEEQDKELGELRAELRSAFGLTGDHEIPHELFEARAATEAPNTKPIKERPVVPMIYKRTESAYLGIEMPQIGPGVASFPALTTGTPAGMKAGGGAADSTAAGFTVATSSPKRVTGQFQVRYEDLAVFPQLEDALRKDIPRSLANEVSAQILTGNGTAPNLNGLFKRLTDADAESTKNTAKTFISTVVGSLDGLNGYELSDLRTLVGKATFVAMSGAYFDNTAVSALVYLKDHTGGVRMSDRIPAVSSDVQSAVVRIGTESGAAVSGVYGGVQLIRDQYTGAGKGEVTVTALQLLSDLHVLRSGAFKEVSFKP